MESLALALYQKSMSQFLRVIKTMNKQQLCSFLGMLYSKSTPTSPQCLKTATNIRLRKYVLKVALNPQLTHYRRFTMFYKIDQEQRVQVLSGGVTPSAGSKIFYQVKPSGKRFDIINFLTEMSEFFLNSLIFNSSLISH